MISWQSLAIAALSVACCGIGAICIAASDRVDEVDASDRTIASGIAAGFVGLLLLAAAFGLGVL